MERCGRGVGKHGLRKGKVPEGVQSKGTGRKKIRVMVGSGSVYGIPVPPFKIVPSRHYSTLSITLGHLQCV